MIMKFSEPNLRWTGLFTVAPSAGSTKNTRGEPAGFAALPAGEADEAGFDESGVPDEHAATKTVRATRASCFMRCLSFGAHSLILPGPVRNRRDGTQFEQRSTPLARPFSTSVATK